MEELSETPLCVSTDEEGLRLDHYLVTKFPAYSRSYLQRLVQQKLVLVNSEQVKKGVRLKKGDEVEIEFALEPELSIEPESIPLDILYEDEDLIVINKPAGLVVHPGAGNWKHTFVNALVYHCQHLPQNDTMRPGIVHRLDKETSGVLVAAKSEQAHRLVVEAFALRNVEKHYLALCVGNPGEGKMEDAIGRHPTRRKEMCVTTQGKEALTLFKTLKTYQGLSFVELSPKTGRTHQLRVHLKAKGTPILGDPVYGIAFWNKKWGATRQLLHAHTLSFAHPRSGLKMHFKAPLPTDMQTILAKAHLL